MSSREASNHESDSGSESDGTESSFQLPDPLALGREKRATAGNRLRDMLNQEIESENMFAEDAEDADFDSDQDQVNDHNSELDSSSEEDIAAQQEADDSGEQALKQQEKAIMKQKKRRAAEAFNKPKPARSTKPIAESAAESTPQAKKEKKTRLPSSLSAQRQSERAHTRKVAGAVEQRLKAARKRQDRQVVAPRTVEHIPTQAERLEEAKRTEAMNVASLNQVVKYEEEKKATLRALQAKRQAAQPTLRIISTTRQSTGEVKEMATQMPVQAPDLSLDHPMDAVARSLAAPSIAPQEPSSGATSSTNTTQPASTKQFVALAHFESAPVARELLLRLPPGAKRKRPPTKVVCPITGRAARYKDPETRVPFASLEAYRILHEVAAGKVPYNTTLDIYTGPAYVPVKR